MQPHIYIIIILPMLRKCYTMILQINVDFHAPPYTALSVDWTGRLTAVFVSWQEKSAVLGGISRYFIKDAAAGNGPM
jgi:hypothetical protein